MKVTLVYPRLKYASGDPPLGIAYVAASLRKNLNVDVSIVDSTFNRSFEYIRSRIEDQRPDVVGVYMDTLMYNDGMKVIDICKEQDLPVIAGGAHPTILPESVITKSDIVCIGEGEQTIVEVIDRLKNDELLDGIKGIWHKENGEIIKEEKRLPIKNLDALEFPAFDLLDMENYFKNWHLLDSVSTNLRGTNLITKRGCPFNCSFCQPTLREIFGNKIRSRSPENVLHEIKFLKEKYRINAFYFHDDTFTAFKPWVDRFCDLLAEESLDLVWGCNSRVDTINEQMAKKMREIGCREFHVGIESGSQRILDDIYNKKIKLGDVVKAVDVSKKVGINVLGFFMMGAPTETRREIENTIKFARSLSLTEASFSLTTPLPKTNLYRRLMEEGVPVSSDFSHYDYYSNRAFDSGIPLHDLKYLQKKAIFMFYSHPKRWRYVLKHITSISGLRKMYVKLMRFI